MWFWDPLNNCWAVNSLSFVTLFQCPFICHLLYLLTRKESGRSNIFIPEIWFYCNFFLVYSIISPFHFCKHYWWLHSFFSVAVRVFRVRKLLELQSKLVNLQSYYIIALFSVKIYSMILLSVHYSHKQSPFPYHWYWVCWYCFLRDDSRSSWTFCHFTKCFALNWWRSPSHLVSRFVHGPFSWRSF